MIVMLLVEILFFVVYYMSDGYNVFFCLEILFGFLFVLLYCYLFIGFSYYR